MTSNSPSLENPVANSEDDDFIEGCLDELRSKSAASPRLNQLVDVGKSVLGRLIEAAVRRQHALDDVLKAVFDRLHGHPVNGDRKLEGNVDERREEAADKRLFVFRRGVELIQREGLLTSRSAGDLVTLLTFQLDDFPAESLFELVEDFLTKIKTADISSEESIELFPKVLACLAAKHNLTTEQGKAESGSEYKSVVINRLLNSKWRRESIVRIVAICKDLDLKEQEEKKLVDLVLSRLDEMEAKDLPPVVYQLLLLSGKHGLQRLVLEGLADFFEERDAKVTDDGEDGESSQIEIHDSNDKSRNLTTSADNNDDDPLQRAQGTVLMHVATAMRHSRELSQEIIKYLKTLFASSSTKKMLRPFNVALALSLAKIPFYEEAVFKLMKDCVVTRFRDAIVTRTSDWLRELLLRPDADTVASDDTVRILQRVVRSATSGWEHILEQLVKFSLILMEMAATAAAAVTSSSSVDWEHSPLIPACLGEEALKGKVKPEQLCGSAGAKMLLLLFDRHDEARDEIVEQLLNRLVVYAHNPVAGFVYAEALAKAAHSAPFSLIESVANQRRVRETVEQLPSFAPALSKCVLSALMPVFKLSPAIRDDLLLTLRKCLYNRKSDSRKAAVHGYLLLLRNFVCQGSSDLSASQMSQTYQFSQVIQPINPRFSGPASSSSDEEGVDGNLALCLELLQSLQRTFSHQADVRDLVLDGLPSIVKRNDRLREAVLDLLVGRLSSYVNQRGLDDEFGGPPVALEKCVQVTSAESVVVSEPLGNLIRCCVAVLRISKEERVDNDFDDDEGSISLSSYKELMTILSKLSLRLSNCELDDFDLNKNTELNTGSSNEGLKNLLRLRILLGVLEALIEFKTFKTTTDDVKIMVNLIRFYTKVQDFIKEGLKAAGGGKKKAEEDGTASQSGSDADASSMAGTGGGGGGKSGASSYALNKAHSTLSLGCISKLLLDVCCSGSSTKHESEGNVARLLRAKHALVKHLFAAGNQKIAQLIATSFCEGASNLTVDQLFRHVSHIGVAAWAQLVSPTPLSEDALSQMQSQEQLSIKRGAQPFKSLLIDTLFSVLSLVKEKFSRKHFEDLVADLHAEAEDGGGVGGDLTDACFAICKELQTQWDKVLRSKDNSKKWGEVGALLALVGQFHSSMNHDSPKFKKILEWLDDVAQGEVIEDAAVVKRLFGQIFASKRKRFEKMYRVATDARIHFGEIEEETSQDNNDDSKELTFQAINLKSAAIVITAVLENVSKRLDDVQFVIGKLKAVVLEKSRQDSLFRLRVSASNASVDDEGDTSRKSSLDEQTRNSREEILSTFHSLQKILGQLCFCKLPFGSPVVKELLKQTKKFYSTLASFVTDVYLTACAKKSAAAAAACVDPSFKSFLGRLQQKLQLNVHPFIFHVEDEKMTAAKKKAQKALQVKTAVRDSLQIPQLVYAMETFDNAVLSLAKITKLELTVSTKNVARDFRITSDKVREVMEEEDEVEEEKENEGGGKGKRKAGAKTAKKMVKKRRLDEEMAAEAGAGGGEREGGGGGGGMITSTQKEASQGRKISIGASADVSVIDNQ